MASLDVLQQIAAKQLSEGRPLHAVKCLEACLNTSPMPADEAQVRLRIARLLLQHTANLMEAKQHLQKAQLLVQKLPSHLILKCEVAALLGRAHQFLGEVEYQKGAYEKGLEVCRRALAGASAASERPQLQRWSCYFHLRMADALAAQADSFGASAAIEQGLEVAQKHGLRVEELVLRMFQLQLFLIAWDRPMVESIVAAVGARLEAETREGEGGPPGGARHDSPAVQQLKLHFNVLQIIYSIRLGQYDQLLKPPEEPGPGSAAAPASIATMEELLTAVRASGGSSAYEWLPLEAQEGLVQLLASVVLRAPGKVKPALAHVAKGLAAVDGALRQLGVAVAEGGGGGGAQQDPAAAVGELGVDHTHTWAVRMLVVLRVLLLESRVQLHLMQSNFAAARSDVACGAALFGRFPMLLELLRPSLHMQAALYAHAVGAWGAAAEHYGRAAAATNDPLGESKAVCLAALARLGQGGPDAVGEGIRLMGDLYSRGADSDAGYGERALAQTAGALLRLATPGEGPQGAALRAEAKVLLGKALKTAHNKLHNHEMIMQLLNAMAPLRVEASDLSGAHEMLKSSFTFAKGTGDLNGQVAALGILQQVYASTGKSEEVACNSNYLAKKKSELAGRLAAAEEDAVEHAAVLAWGLGTAA